MAEWRASKYYRENPKNYAGQGGIGNYRDRNTGAVYNRSGKLIGYEPKKNHVYGDDKYFGQGYKAGAKRPNVNLQSRKRMYIKIRRK